MRFILMSCLLALMSVYADITCHPVRAWDGESATVGQMCMSDKEVESWRASGGATVEPLLESAVVK